VCWGNQVLIAQHVTIHSTITRVSIPSGQGSGVGVERVREGTFMMIFETRECGVKVISLASSSSSGA